MNPIADTLDAAADLIEFEGHWQGGPVDDEHMTYCAHTAANQIGGHDAVDVTRALARYLGHTEDEGIAVVFEWNDITPTDEVIDTMRRCAKALREVTA